MHVAASTVWEILKEAGIDPAPERACSTWAVFLRSQSDALLACDFLETVTLTGARMYVLAVIEQAVFGKCNVEAIARPLHVGRTFIVADTELRDRDDRLVARVTQTQAVLRS